MENSTNKQKTKRTTKTAPKKSERIIYVGPNLPRGELQRYMLFKGGLPQHIEHVFKRYPLIKALFIAPGKMAETERKMISKGTLENAAYMQVVTGGILPQPKEELVKGDDTIGNV